MLLSAKNVPEFTCPYTVALEARLSHDRSGSGTMPGKCELSQSVEPGGARRLSLARSTVVQNKCTLVPALCREGLFLVYCIRREKRLHRLLPSSAFSSSCRVCTMYL